MRTKSIKFLPSLPKPVVCLTGVTLSGVAFSLSCGLSCEKGGSRQRVRPASGTINKRCVMLPHALRDFRRARISAGRAFCDLLDRRVQGARHLLH